MDEEKRFYVLPPFILLYDALIAHGISVSRKNTRLPHERRNSLPLLLAGALRAIFDMFSDRHHCAH